MQYRRHRRRRRSKAVIHVRSGENRSSIEYSKKKTTRRISKKTREIIQYQQPSSQYRQPIIKTDSSIEQPSKIHSRTGTNNSGKSLLQNSSQIKHAWIEDKGNTIEHHHNVKKKKKKKKDKNRLAKIVVITATIVSIIIITVILSVLLTRPKNVSISRTAVLRWNTTGITVAGRSGVSGNSSDLLSTPFDATLDSENNLYVSDTSNNRVQKYLAGSLNGTTVAGNASGFLGSGSSDLKRPSQVITVSYGNFFVSDTYNQRIMWWTNGSSSGTVVAGLTGISGSTNNTLNVPFNLYYDSTSNSLYISDYANYRVMHYFVGASSGTMVAGTGVLGTNTTQLTRPVGIYFDSLTNSLIIGNHNGHNIVRWPLGATHWTLLAGNLDGTLGSNSTSLYRPTRITLDPMGNLYVADRDNQRIQLFMNGHFEGITIAGITGVSGSNATLFSAPWSVAFDSQLNLYVADSNNHRIQKFLRY